MSNYLESPNSFLKKITISDTDSFIPLEVTMLDRNIENDEPYFCVYSYFVKDNFEEILNDLHNIDKNSRIGEYTENMIGFINFVEDEFNTNPDLKYSTFLRTKKAVFFTLIDGENYPYNIFVEDKEQKFLIRDIRTGKVFDSIIV